MACPVGRRSGPPRMTRAAAPATQPMTMARSESNEMADGEELREGQAEDQRASRARLRGRWSHGRRGGQGGAGDGHAGRGGKAFAGERAEHVVELDHRDGGVGRELVEEEHDDEGDRDAQCHGHELPPPTVAEGEQQAGDEAHDGEDADAMTKTSRIQVGMAPRPWSSSVAKVVRVSPESHWRMRRTTSRTPPRRAGAGRRVSGRPQATVPRRSRPQEVSSRVRCRRRCSPRHRAAFPCAHASPLGDTRATESVPNRARSSD